ncbi:hypothetical protein DVH24_034283 [Malus domestica]|uniref:Uncharacterized protein n=1 Tax=Malus domestica TaxID=3750 RepID=A0A498J0R0_MALDO|nr:hypothetical protein DVH24_034283 [Malus domestica]
MTVELMNFPKMEDQKAMPGFDAPVHFSSSHPSPSQTLILAPALNLSPTLNLTSTPVSIPVTTPAVV